MLGQPLKRCFYLVCEQSSGKWRHQYFLFWVFSLGPSVATLVQASQSNPSKNFLFLVFSLGPSYQMGRVYKYIFLKSWWLTHSKYDDRYLTLVILFIQSVLQGRVYHCFGIFTSMTWNSLSFKSFLHTLFSEDNRPSESADDWMSSGNNYGFNWSYSGRMLLALISSLQHQLAQQHSWQT